MMEIKDIVFDLIVSKREGDYWDFKLKPHENSAELIKDIICLANCVRHKGERYIIFGVDDNGNIVGLSNSDRLTQANIIDMLSKVSFSKSKHPDISLFNIEIEKRYLQVLVIKDEPEKPFYLESEYKYQGRTLNAGTIYSRTQDRNTPINGVAASHDIELMWKERFGLTQSLIERIKLYLIDYKNWVELNPGSGVYSYIPSPEFTVEYIYETQELSGGQSWARFSTYKRIFSSSIECKHNQNMLGRWEILNYDNGKSLLMPDQDSLYLKQSWIPMFYFCIDNIDFTILLFWENVITEYPDKEIRTKESFLQDKPFPTVIANSPILVFLNKAEKTMFKEYISLNPNSINSYNYHPAIDRLDSIGGERKVIELEEIKLSSKLERVFEEWKKLNRI